jgi:hypothetical protein
MQKNIMISGLLACLLLAGCGAEGVNDLSFERLSSESSVIAFCDSDDDNKVIESELEACKNIVGYQQVIDELPMVPSEETTPEDLPENEVDPETPLSELPQSGGAEPIETSDIPEGEIPPTPNQTITGEPLEIELYKQWFNPQPLGDVVAFAEGTYIVYDAEAGGASIEGDGERSYMTTDGFTYVMVDGQWNKLNISDMSGMLNVNLNDIGEVSAAAEVPANIPVADMPFKASNYLDMWVLAPRWEFKKCDNGSECLEIETFEGGTLRYDKTARLVEVVMEGQLISFTHGERVINIPDAVQVDIPNFGGMNMPGMPGMPNVPDMPAGMPGTLGPGSFNTGF